MVLDSPALDGGGGPLEPAFDPLEGLDGEVTHRMKIPQDLFGTVRGRDELPQLLDPNLQEGAVDRVDLVLEHPDPLTLFQMQLPLILGHLPPDVQNTQINIIGLLPLAPLPLGDLPQGTMAIPELVLH